MTGVAEPVEALEAQSAAPLARTLWYCENLSADSAEAEAGAQPADASERRQVGSEVEANLVSSLLDDGRHAPTLDIDLPCELRASSTAGHFHLLIEKPMSWKAYERLLAALTEAGLVEKAYYERSVERQQTFLRLPHVRKPGAAEPPPGEHDRHAIEEGSLSPGGSVYLLWDCSREEHGEAPELVGVYGDKEAAEAHIRREQEAADVGPDEEGCLEEPFPFSIEERDVLLASMSEAAI